MTQIEPVIPQEGKPGMTVDDLIFHRHEMAQSAYLVEDALKGLPSDTLKFMATFTENLKSTKHAVVVFANGSSLSVITGTPAHDGSSFGRNIATFARGDERVPTYEVSYSIPGRDSIILNYQTPDQVNEILDELARLPS